MTPATTAPIIMPIGRDDDDDDDDGADCLGGGISLTQSSEVTDSSIAGQSGSISKMTLSTVTDGLDCTHSLIKSTIPSASETEAGTGNVIIARNTTVFSKSPWDPRQLKVLSIMLLELNSHEQRIIIACTIPALMSLCFNSLSISYRFNACKYVYKCIHNNNTICIIHAYIIFAYIVYIQNGST